MNPSSFEKHRLFCLIKSINRSPIKTNQSWFPAQLRGNGTGGLINGSLILDESNFWIEWNGSVNYSPPFKVRKGQASGNGVAALESGVHPWNGVFLSLNTIFLISILRKMACYYNNLYASYFFVCFMLKNQLMRVRLQSIIIRSLKSIGFSSSN